MRPRELNRIFDRLDRLQDNVTRILARVDVPEPRRRDELVALRDLVKALERNVESIAQRLSELEKTSHG